jgi:hypothetical protein
MSALLAPFLTSTSRRPATAPRLPNRLAEAGIALVRRVSDFCRGPQPDIQWMLDENIKALVALVGAEHSPPRVLQCVARSSS